MVRGRIRDTLRRSQAGVVRVALIVFVTTACSALSAQQPPPADGTPRDMDALKARGGLASLPSPTWVQKRPIPLDVHFAVQSDLTRTDPPYNKGHIRTRETSAGDAGVAFKAGDAILTGTEKDSWPIAKATFEATYAPSEGSRMGQDGKFFKKPQPILGVQMKEPFAVTASWGRLEGKPGDWLVQYDEAGKDFGIVGEAIFEQTYERLPVTPDLRAKLDAMRARVPKD
jgi:PGDYG protein